MIKKIADLLAKWGLITPVELPPVLTIDEIILKELNEIKEAAHLLRIKLTDLELNSENQPNKYKFAANNLHDVNSYLLKTEANILKKDDFKEHKEHFMNLLDKVDNLEIKMVQNKAVLHDFKESLRKEAIVESKVVFEDAPATMNYDDFSKTYGNDHPIKQLFQ
jgi:hypothetical protein